MKNTIEFNTFNISQRRYKLKIKERTLTL
jgi:hypothetical protein